MANKYGLRLQLVTTQGILIDSWDLDDFDMEGEEYVHTSDEVTAAAKKVATYMPSHGWFLKPEYI